MLTSCQFYLGDQGLVLLLMINGNVVLLLYIVVVTTILLNYLVIVTLMDDLIFNFFRWTCFLSSNQSRDVYRLFYRMIVISPL